MCPNTPYELPYATTSPGAGWPDTAKPCATRAGGRRLTDHATILRGGRNYAPPLARHQPDPGLDGLLGFPRHVDLSPEALSGLLGEPLSDRLVRARPIHERLDQLAVLRLGEGTRRAAYSKPLDSTLM
jgi:hypothetical protein